MKLNVKKTAAVAGAIAVITSMTVSAASLTRQDGTNTQQCNTDIQQDSLNINRNNQDIQQEITDEQNFSDLPQMEETQVSEENVPAEQQSVLDDIKAADETILGRVVEITDEYVTVEIVHNVNGERKQDHSIQDETGDFNGIAPEGEPNEEVTDNQEDRPIYGATDELSDNSMSEPMDRNAGDQMDKPADEPGNEPVSETVTIYLSDLSEDVQMGDMIHIMFDDDSAISLAEIAQPNGNLNGFNAGQPGENGDGNGFDGEQPNGEEGFSIEA